MGVVGMVLLLSWSHKRLLSFMLFVVGMVTIGDLVVV